MNKKLVGILAAVAITVIIVVMALTKPKLTSKEEALIETPISNTLPDSLTIDSIIMDADSAIEK